MRKQGLAGGAGDTAARSGQAGLLPAAQRALAEAEERRCRHPSDRARTVPEEIKGRGGPDPVRYGDWEVRGIATDF